MRRVGVLVMNTNFTYCIHMQKVFDCIHIEFGYTYIYLQFLGFIGKTAFVFHSVKKLLFFRGIVHVASFSNGDHKSTYQLRLPLLK